MRKTLEELWNGNITPQMRLFHPGTPYAVAWDDVILYE